MKTILITLTLGLLVAYQASAQVFVDGVNVNEQTITYCQLIGINRTIFSGTRIWIDYGQPKFTTANSQQISGQDAVARKFNSVMDALNFMVQNGWELVSSNVTSSKEEPTTYVYLLRKRVQ
ncbi:hypothetical protein [Spirosoma fluminis]